MKSIATSFFQRLLLLSITLMLGTAKQLYGQTNWTGAVSTAWNTAGNWSAGVPDAADDVTIGNVTNDPVISVANAVAKSVTVQTSGLLTISAAGSLTINGATTQGFLNRGTVQNNGTINIGNTSAVGTYGLNNETTFNNNIDAQLNINRSGSSALYNTSGNLTNAGTISIGALASAGTNGISLVAGSITNNSDAQIFVDRATTYAILSNNGSFNNAGFIDIGSLAGGGDMVYGIGFGASFTNTNSGQINIDRVSYGISAVSGTFANAGVVTIGALSSNSFALIDDQGTGIFSNNAGGNLKGSGAIGSARFTNAGGFLVPGYSPGIMSFNGSESFANSFLDIEINGKATAGVNYDQLNVTGTATLGGSVTLTINYTPTVGDRITILSATAISGTFGTINGLPANWNVVYTAVGVTLVYGPVVVNTWTGAVNSNWSFATNWTSGVPDATDDVIIPNVTNDPVISTTGAIAKSIKVQTGAVLTVSATGSLAVNGASTQAVWNQGMFNNTGSVQIGNTSNIGAYGIFNEGIFNNNAGSQLTVDRASTAGIELLSNTFTNAGTITIGGLVPMTNLMLGETGTFNNNTNGILKGTGNLPAANFTNAGGTISPGYSPGKMTFTGAESFTNNKLAIELNGPGVAGIDFDQLLVSGTATLGGTLTLSINYAANPGDQFTIVSATAISGTFQTITGLPANWIVGYYPNMVVVSYGPPQIQTTWTGAISSSWLMAGNWSAGVPDTSFNVIIPNVANDPVIGVAGAVAKSVTVQSGGVLTIGAAGSLTINNAGIYGVLNLGTVANNGIINIGNTSRTGKEGFRNEATFNNNSGAQLNINRSDTCGLANWEINATINNAGTINVGAISIACYYGIMVEDGIFNNLPGGLIKVDRVLTYAIHTRFYSIFNNAGTIDIGSKTGGKIINTGIVIGGSFNNNTGGQINIDSVYFGLHAYTNSLANAGIITISPLPSSFSELIFEQGSGTVSNNTGGIFKGTGIIISDRFTNAGGTLAPGYSPGTMFFDTTENFANSIMAIEVNGTDSAGLDYDRINVNGTATLGGTLALSINFTPMNGNQVPILKAKNISGTFTSITGLPANWRVTYTATAVILVYDLTTTWTGNVSNNWNTAGNWSSGAIPTAINDVVIPNVTIDPIISTAGAVARTIHVMPGGSLTLNATGSLTTNGVLPFNGVNAAIYNQGTMTVKGPLMVKPN
ncbi:MAG: hypothetical protein V4722_22385 [Bacteroidota bacterium]